MLSYGPGSCNSEGHILYSAGTDVVGMISSTATANGKGVAAAGGLVAILQSSGKSHYYF